MITNLSKKDWWFALLTGAGTGLIVWRILHFLGYVSLKGLALSWLVLLVPPTALVAVAVQAWIRKPGQRAGLVLLV